MSTKGDCHASTNQINKFISISFDLESKKQTKKRNKEIIFLDLSNFISSIGLKPHQPALDPPVSPQEPPLACVCVLNPGGLFVLASALNGLDESTVGCG